MASLINETACKKALHLTFLSVNGLSNNDHAGIVQNEITGNELSDELIEAVQLILKR